MKRSACVAMGVLLMAGVAGCKSGTTSGTTSAPATPTPSVVPAQTQVQTQPAPTLSCTIDASNYAWNPAGQMDVKVDGVSVGAFAFDRRGSSALNFSCSPGVHSFRMEAAGTPINCEGNFSVDAQHTDFLPTMDLLKGGQTVCGLSVNGR